jgi:hypothetical protein
MKVFDEEYGWPILDYEDTYYYYSGELIYGLQMWEFYAYSEDLDFYEGYCGAFEDLATCVYDLTYYADDSDYDELIACSDYYSCDSTGCLIYTYGEDIGYEAFAV